MNLDVIDIEGLKKLSGNDTDFVNEILKLYKERTTKDIEELQNAAVAEDWNSVRFVVHRMRSAAVPLGLKSLVVLLKRIELGIGESTPVELKNQLDEVFAITQTAMKDAQNKLDLKSV
jgi:HPt (histidine-containing phosphotransfer) domain-containing protein